MLDQQNEHTMNLDCWCNPHILRADTKLLVEQAGMVATVHLMSRGEVVVHIDSDQRVLGEAT